MISVITTQASCLEPWTLPRRQPSLPLGGVGGGLEPRLRRLLWATLNLHQGFFEGKKIATMKATKSPTVTHHGQRHTAMMITRILNTIIAPWNISPFIGLTSTKIRIIFHISNCFADFYIKNDIRRSSLAWKVFRSYCRQKKIFKICNLWATLNFEPGTWNYL